MVHVVHEIQRCTNNLAKAERIKSSLIPLQTVQNFFEIEDAAIAKPLDSWKSFHSSDSQLISTVQHVHFLSRCFRCFLPRIAAGVLWFQNRLSRRVLQTLWEWCDINENTIRTWHFDIRQCISFHIYSRDWANSKSDNLLANNHNVCHWISLGTALPNKNLN